MYNKSIEIEYLIRLVLLDTFARPSGRHAPSHPIDTLAGELLEREPLGEADLRVDLCALVIESKDLNDEDPGAPLDREPLLGLALHLAPAALILVIID